MRVFPASSILIRVLNMKTVSAALFKVKCIPSFQQSAIGTSPKFIHSLIMRVQSLNNGRGESAFAFNLVPG